MLAHEILVEAGELSSVIQLRAATVWHPESESEKFISPNVSKNPLM